MIDTIPRPRSRIRPRPLAPSIREVCLFGSPDRRYIHLAGQGLGTDRLRTQDPGLGSEKSAIDVGTG